MTNSFCSAMAAAARRVSARWIPAALGLVLSCALGHAAVLYTFSNTGASPYSFSLLEPGLLNTTGAFAIPPFQEGGLTFTQATFAQAGGTDCFQFGTAGAALSATPFSCNLSAFPPEGGWQSLFFGVNGLGAYTAFNAASGGNAPAAPNQLTIRNILAFQYTFSNHGPNPYSFSFLEPSVLTTTGAFAIAPFQVDGFSFTQASLVLASRVTCFQFGSPGAVLNATPFSCGLNAFPPGGGWQDLFFGGSAPGTYTAFNAAVAGNAPAAPTELTIAQQTPEPGSSWLLAGGLAILGLVVRYRRVESVTDRCNAR